MYFHSAKNHSQYWKQSDLQKSELSSESILTLRAIITLDNLHFCVTLLWHLTFDIPSAALSCSDDNAIIASNTRIINVGSDPWDPWFTHHCTSHCSPALPLVCQTSWDRNSTDYAGETLLLLPHWGIPWRRIWNCTLSSEQVSHRRSIHSPNCLANSQSI